VKENVVYQGTVVTETTMENKMISDSAQISKNSIETIKHPSSTPAKERGLSYRNTSGTSKTEKSRFALSGEF